MCNSECRRLHSELREVASGKFVVNVPDGHKLIDSFVFVLSSVAVL